MNTLPQTSVAPYDQFKENIKRELAEKLGSLIPEDVLKALVDSAIQDLFFKKRVERSPYGRDVEHPSWFAELVASEINTMVKEDIRKKLDENQDKLKEMIATTLVEQLPLMVSDFLVKLTSNNIHSIINSMNYNRN